MKGSQNQSGVEELGRVRKGEELLDSFEKAPKLKDEDDIAEMFEKDEHVTKGSRCREIMSHNGKPQEQVNSV